MQRLISWVNPALGSRIVLTHSAVSARVRARGCGSVCDATLCAAERATRRAPSHVSGRGLKATQSHTEVNVWFVFFFGFFFQDLFLLEKWRLQNFGKDCKSEITHFSFIKIHSLFSVSATTEVARLDPEDFI